MKITKEEKWSFLLSYGSNDLELIYMQSKAFNDSTVQRLRTNLLFIWKKAKSARWLSLPHIKQMVIISSSPKKMNIFRRIKNWLFELFVYKLGSLCSVLLIFMSWSIWSNTDKIFQPLDWVFVRGCTNDIVYCLATRTAKQTGIYVYWNTFSTTWFNNIY